MRHLINILMLLLPLLAAACGDAADEAPAAAGGQQPTYRMTLNAAVRGYDAPTRAAAYTFEQGDRMHLLFDQAGGAIAGTAVYDAATASWTITTDKPLSETDDGQCRLAFFPDDSGTVQGTVKLTQQTRLYTDAEAYYQFTDEEVSVQAMLTPPLGRIRFHGQPGQKCTVAGLSFATTFSLATHTLELSPSSFTATCEADGYTPYSYGVFSQADRRQLTFLLTAQSGLRRQFAAGVLAAGSSGYVDIPTAESHDGWTLVSLPDGDEIGFPVIAAPTVGTVGSARFTVSATVTSTGGGHLSAVGFVVSKATGPTRSNTDVSCTVANSFSALVSGLDEQTTYYVRAYAVNEAGTAYSEETIVVTKAKADDGSDVDRQDWPADDNWNETQGAQADVDRQDWPTDENWN